MKVKTDFHQHKIKTGKRGKKTRTQCESQKDQFKTQSMVAFPIVSACTKARPHDFIGRLQVRLT